MKRYQMQIDAKFPDVNCDPIYDVYGDKLEHFAHLDWKMMQQAHDKNQAYSVYLACFC